MGEHTESTEGPWGGADRRKIVRTNDWQSSVERDKAALARSLHDHSGGLLAAAMMDVTWSEMHLDAAATEVRSRLRRAHATLNVAIDLNRRMIEELRPTLLDNFGLVAALKWHFTGVCESGGIQCDQQYPDPPPQMPSRTAIALYRISQTILSLMFACQSRQVSIALALADGCITLKLRGSGMPNDCSLDNESTRDALSSVGSRIRTLGGSMAFQFPPGAAAFEFELPALASVAPNEEGSPL